jgi:hypothetical protein
MGLEKDVTGKLIQEFSLIEFSSKFSLLLLPNVDWKKGKELGIEADKGMER